MTVAMHDVHAALDAPAGFTVRPFRQSWEHRRAEYLELVKGDGVIFVARPTNLPEQIAGYATISVRPSAHRPMLVPDTPREGELESLVVASEYRRRGVARALLDCARAWLREEGAGTMLVGVRAANIEAQSAYEELGARPAFVVLALVP